MKTLRTKFFNVFTRNVGMKSACVAVVLLFAATGVYAAAATPAGMSTFDGVIKVIATWLGRIGLVVGFFGGVQLALGFRNDDA